MYRKYFLCLVLFSFMVAGNTPMAYAKKKAKTKLKLVEAYTQKTIPGIPGAQPHTDYFFIITWEGPQCPESFFWRGDNGWLTCAVAKAHKTGKEINKTHHGAESQDYTAEVVAMANIHKGDTLLLKPMPGGKFPIPAEIPNDATNTLFYKTGGSGWLSLPVKTIGKKPDRAMP